MFTVILFASYLGFVVGMSLILDGWWILLWAVLGIPAAWIGVVLGMIFFLIITAPLPLKSRFKNYVWRSASFTVNRFLVHLSIQVIGQEKIPKDGKVVIYANHKSYLDPVIMLEVIKRPSAFTPKHTLYRIPILNAILKSLGCVPIYRNNNRKTAQSLIQMIKNVEQGFVMSVFPEGGRKNRETDQVVATRAGAFKIATKPKATILPMTINGNSLIQHNAPWRKTKITVVVHDPIPYESYQKLSTNEIADMVALQINAGIIE